MEASPSYQIQGVIMLQSFTHHWLYHAIRLVRDYTGKSSGTIETMDIKLEEAPNAVSVRITFSVQRWTRKRTTKFVNTYSTINIPKTQRRMINDVFEKRVHRLWWPRTCCNTNDTSEKIQCVVQVEVNDLIKQMQSSTFGECHFGQNTMHHKIQILVADDDGRCSARRKKLHTIILLCHMLLFCYAGLHNARFVMICVWSS